MTRVILFIIVAGNIMWGSMVVCGFAAIPGDPAANATMQSGMEVSLYFLNEQTSSFDSPRGREDVPLFYLMPERHGFAVKPMNSFLVADTYVCRTPKGDCSTSKTDVRDDCYCPNGDDGTVVRIRSDSPINNGQGPQGNTNPLGDDIEKASKKSNKSEESED